MLGNIPQVNLSPITSNYVDGYETDWLYLKFDQNDSSEMSLILSRLY
jgi:hypothetical protein